MQPFFLLLLTLYSSITVSFAQQCPAKTSGAIAPIMTLAQNSLASTCQLQRDQYKCSELEAELESDEKKKVIQCDLKSIEENKLSNMNLGSCIFSGIKLSGEQLLDLAHLPGKIAESVVKGFHDTQLCNASTARKKELLTAFNLSVDDSRFKLSEQFLGKWLEDASCAEIDKLLFARYQNYQNVLMSERIAAINTGKKPVALVSKEGGTDLIALLKSAMSAAQVRYECYTPKVKAEMICAGVTSLIVDTAMGMGIKSAMGKISAVVKSKKALAAINRAVAAGEKVNLKDAAKLTNADRKRAALELLNGNLENAAKKRVLSEAEEKALIRAHEVGAPDRGYFTYTKEDLAEKMRLLKEAGFTPTERRLLMESGITGEIKDPWVIKAISTHYQKAIGKGLTAEQTSGILKMEALGSTSGQAFQKANPRLFLEQAGFEKSEIDLIFAAKKAEELRLAKGLPYKDPVAPVKPIISAAKVADKTKAVDAPVSTTVTVLDHAEKASKLSLKQALEESEKLRIPRDAKGLRVVKNGKEVVASAAEREASSEYLYRASKIEREAMEEAYRKKNRTYKADVEFINKYVDNALEASLNGDGSVARKIIRDALNSGDNSMKNINGIITHIYETKFEFPNANEAQKAASALRKENLKKVLDEVKALKGDSLLTNGNNGVFRSMSGRVSSP